MTKLESNAGPRRVRVALVEQYALVAETFEVALRTLCVPIPVVIDQGAGRTLVATSILGVRPTVAVLHLDSVVADESIPIEELAAANVVTVVLTDRWDDARLGEFLRRGADVALSTSLGLSRLAHVITRAAAHQPAMESDELARLRDARRPAVDPDAEAARSACARLSTREGVILRSLMSGMSPVEIAHHDYVSAATVRTQVRSILSKLGVGSQLSAVALGFRAGWRPAEPEPPARVTHAV